MCSKAFARDETKVKSQKICFKTGKNATNVQYHSRVVKC